MKVVQAEQVIGWEDVNSRIRLADLGLILFGGLFLISLIWAGEANPSVKQVATILRVSLGLAYVLFVPGYLLQAALFPHKGDLEVVERTGLSLGLSVALVPVLALVLDRLPWGLRLWPIVIEEGLMILLLLLVAAWRRWSVGAETAYAPNLRLRPDECWRGLETADRRLYMLAGGALLLAVLAAVWVFLVPSDEEFMTEFYMLGKGGMAEDFPRQAQVGESLSVTLGIHNLERGVHTYRTEIWAVDPWVEGKRQLVASVEPMSLEREGKVEQPVSWSMPWAGEDQQVELSLYIDDQPEPYRRLVLWLNVSE